MTVKFENPYSKNIIIEDSVRRRDFLYFGWTGYPFFKRGVYGLALLYFMTTVALLTMIVMDDASLFSGIAEFFAGMGISVDSRQVLICAFILYVIWCGYSLGIGKTRLAMLYLRRDYFIAENDAAKRAEIMNEWGLTESAFLKEDKKSK